MFIYANDTVTQSAASMCCSSEQCALTKLVSYICGCSYWQLPADQSHDCEITAAVEVTMSTRHNYAMEYIHLEYNQKTCKLHASMLQLTSYNCEMATLWQFAEQKF